MKGSQSGPGFSHIFFADDLLLFAKANARNSETILEILDHFCEISGQKVSSSKSRVVFSPNVDDQTKTSICNMLGISATSEIGRYLGFPIFHKGRNCNAFNFVIDKVQSKLAGWKAKVLSPAGRLVLIKSVSATIPDYYMQCHALPIKTCSAIDKLNRDFLWGSTQEKRKLHLVNWNVVTLPKLYGGLGIFQMRARNEALLAKLCWRIAINPEALWAKTLIKKYFSGSSVGRKKNCSCIWAACRKGGTIFLQGLKWTIYNGRSVNFWSDFWLSLGLIRSLIEGPLASQEDALTVWDVKELGVANLSLQLLEFIIQAISATPFANNAELHDSPVWAFSKNGDFSLSAAYVMAKGLNPLNLCTSPISWIWKIKSSPRIIFFLWLVGHNSIPTCEVLGSRGFTLDTCCPCAWSSLNPSPMC